MDKNYQAIVILSDIYCNIYETFHLKIASIIPQVDNTFRCPGCRFPMCNERCTKGDRHQDECEFFKLHEKLQKESNNNSTNLIRLITSSPEVTSHVFVTPLRMLLKKKTDPKTFSRIDMLMDHAEHRAATANSINFQMAKVLKVMNIVHRGG